MRSLPNDQELLGKELLRRRTEEPAIAAHVHADNIYREEITYQARGVIPPWYIDGAPSVTNGVAVNGSTNGAPQ